MKTLKIRNLFAAAALALASVLPSQAFAITNSLFLSIDGSGSISSGEFTLQVDGYVSALNTVLGGGAYYGDLAVGVNIFGFDVATVFGMQVLNDATDLASLTSAIAGLDPGRGGISTGATNITGALNGAVAAIQGDATFATATNKVIDVSTDGAWNTGGDPDPVAAAALANHGITTNCLGVGGGANCSFATGFSVQVADFAGFEQALIDKLERELGGGVPEPSTVLLLGIGLAGIGFARRRRTT